MDESQRRALHEKAQAERKCYRRWLVLQMKDGQLKTKPKTLYRNAAVVELGVSQAAFDEAGLHAIEDTGRYDWSDTRSSTSR